MISGYRLMWLLVMFDLPVTTKEDRRNYREFHDFLLNQGFTRMQFSVYARPCATEERTQVQVERTVDALPPNGEVRILKFTDKQWTRTLLFRRARNSKVEQPPEQFDFFDEEMEPLVAEDEPSTIRTQIYVAETRGTYGEKPTKPAKPTKPLPKKKPKPKQSGEGTLFDFLD